MKNLALHPPHSASQVPLWCSAQVAVPCIVQIHYVLEIRRGHEEEAPHGGRPNKTQARQNTQNKGKRQLLFLGMALGGLAHFKLPN